jgi:hypothetical protein
MGRKEVPGKIREGEAATGPDVTDFPGRICSHRERTNPYLREVSTRENCWPKLHSILLCCREVDYTYRHPEWRVRALAM